MKLNRSLTLSLSVVAISLTLGACSTVDSQLYGQTEVDASGPEPVWSAQPEKAIRQALDRHQHVFIGTADGDKRVGLVTQACDNAAASALQSGFVRKNLPHKETWWNRTKGMMGEEFHAKCLLSTEKDPADLSDSQDSQDSQDAPPVHQHHHKKKKSVHHVHHVTATDSTNFN